MASKEELDLVYMQMARSLASLSKAKRKQVGCLIVTPENVMLGSYNGTPSGWDNECEYEEWKLSHAILGETAQLVKTGELITYEHVVHAEVNAIAHAARQGVSLKNSTAYITLCPCIRCCATVASSGIVRVVYDEDYRDMRGVDLLRKNGVEVVKL